MGIQGRDESLRALAGGRLVMVRADPGMGVTTLLDAYAAGLREDEDVHRITVVRPRGLTELSGGLPAWAEPSVVVFDDLHHADDASLLFLHQLAEDLPNRRLRVVTGRHRGVEPARFERLDRLGTVLDLGPLDEAVAKELGGEQAAVRSGGNPRLLNCLLAADPEAEVLAWVAGLAGEDLSLLRFAALLDQPVPIGELAEVSGRPPTEVMSALHQLGARGLVDDQSGAVRFRHAAIREVLASTSTGLRGCVAQALVHRGAPPVTVVRHLAQAPLDGWAVDWAVKQADELSSWPTPGVAELLAAAVDRLPPGDVRQHRLRAALAETLLWTGNPAEARHVAAAGLAAHPEPALVQRLRAALVQIAITEMEPEAALAVLAEGPGSGYMAALEAFVRTLTGDLEGAVRSIERAMRLGADHPLAEVILLHVRAGALCLSRELEAALELLDHAEALLDIVVRDPGQWLLSRILRATVYDMRHDPATLETVELARPLARQVGGAWHCWLQLTAAVALYNGGRWEDSLAEVDVALSAPRHYGLARALHGMAAHILLHRGDVAGARRHVDAAEQHEEVSGISVFYGPVLLSAHAVLADLEGNREESLAMVRRIAGGEVGGHPGNAVPSAGPHLVRIALGAGDQELAEQLVAQMRLWVSDGSIGQEASLWYCQGMVDGDADVLLAAAARFAEGGSPVGAARAEEDAAILLAASGKSEDARTVYRGMVDKYAYLAASADIARAGAALRTHGVRLGVTGRRGRPKRGWDSLTNAEYRVAEMVADGSTNREIAQRLVISVRTVDSHVSRMLTKLGYSSRIAIAREFRPRR